MKVKTIMMFRWFLSKKSNLSLLVKRTKQLKRRRKKSQNELKLLGIISIDSCTHKVNREQEYKTLYRPLEMKTYDNY